jgi:hypothetical protein
VLVLRRASYLRVPQHQRGSYLLVLLVWSLIDVTIYETEADEEDGQDRREAPAEDPLDFALVEKGMRPKNKPKALARIFSGPLSRPMWDEINGAKTVGQLKWALYSVCCRLQEFESFVRRTTRKG